MHLYENNIKSVLFKGLKFYCKKVQEKKKAAKCLECNSEQHC